MSDVFVKITNREIYDKLQELIKNNEQQHEAIISRIDYTNGKVRLNRWISTTALSLIIALIFGLLSKLAL